MLFAASKCADGCYDMKYKISTTKRTGILGVWINMGVYFLSSWAVFDRFVWHACWSIFACVAWMVQYVSLLGNFPFHSFRFCHSSLFYIRLVGSPTSLMSPMIPWLDGCLPISSTLHTDALSYLATHIAYKMSKASLFGFIFSVSELTYKM